MTTWTIDRPDRRTFTEPVTSLHVRLISGRLNVVGTDGPARIEVSTVGSRKLLVSLDAGRLSVRLEEPDRRDGLWRWLTGHTGRVRTDVSIALPRDAVADLGLVSGDTVVSDLRAGVGVDVTSGAITLLGITGPVTARTVSGSVEALGVHGDLRTDTVSGEIVLADCASRRVTARTISGALTCDVDNPAGSDINLETTSGSITARVREDSDLAVSLTATSGNVTTDFPGLTAQSRRGPGRKVEGRLGQGLGWLRARAISGNIALLRRPVGDDLVEGPGPDPVDQPDGDGPRPTPVDGPQQPTPGPEVTR